MTGRAVCCAISRTISSVNAPGCDEVPIKIVGGELAYFVTPYGERGRAYRLRSDGDRVAAKAIEKGLLTTDQLAGMSRREIFELIFLPGGGMVIDTPGMRELQLWGDGEGLQDAFADVEEIALGCKFTNCLHEHEPGCAIRKAVNAGKITPQRYQSYLKLMDEGGRQ